MSYTIITSCWYWCSTRVYHNGG